MNVVGTTLTILYNNKKKSLFGPKNLSQLDVICEYGW